MFVSSHCLGRVISMVVRESWTVSFLGCLTEKIGVGYTEALDLMAGVFLGGFFSPGWGG